MLAAILVQVTGILPGTEVSPADAAAELAKSAYAVDPPGTGQFAYSLSKIRITSRLDAGSSSSRYGKPGSLVRTSVTFARWLSTNRPGRVSAKTETSVGGRTFPAKTEGGSERLVTTYSIGRRQYTPADLARLGSEPAEAVADVLAAAATQPESRRVGARWQYSIDPLRSFGSILPASVRAELIRSLGEIPGISVAKTGGESEGTQSFSLLADGFRQEAVFDTSTAVLVRASTTIARSDTPSKLKPGTTASEYELLRSANVSDVGKTR